MPAGDVQPGYTFFAGAIHMTPLAKETYRRRQQGLSFTNQI
jgi:hypothetical protein